MVTPASEPIRRTGARALRPGVILALVCGAQFMVVLDIAIVNVTLPSVQADLALDQSNLQWVVITYGLLLGGLLLLGGRAADLLGRRLVLLAGLALFTASSLAAGLVGSLAQLVASRAGQGLGAALAAPAALSILVSTFPEGAARNKALGIFGAVAGSAASIGVILSGALATGPGWEWIFFVNVPVGLALVTLILRFVPDRDAGQRGSRQAAAGSAPRRLPALREGGSAAPRSAALLGYLTDLGVPWAIATSGQRANAAPSLTGLGVPDHVPVITRDALSRAKPDPDLFLAAPGSRLRRSPPG